MFRKTAVLSGSEDMGHATGMTEHRGASCQGLAPYLLGNNEKNYYLLT
ncbi:hypothetical protein ACQKDB_04505 [Planococcus kocurii]